MSKKNSKKQIKRLDKKVRQLLESTGEMVKLKGDVNKEYRFKSKNKKQLKKIRKTCTHWIIRKGDLVPTVKRDEQNPDYWICTLCGERFQTAPYEIKKDAAGNVIDDPYKRLTNEFTGLVNNTIFIAIKAGGDAEDTKLMLELREKAKEFKKVGKELSKLISKVKDTDRRSKMDTMSNFDMYGSYNYRG